MNPAIVKAQIIKIGNSQGIRIPKPVLNKLGLGKEVELEILSNYLIIRPIKQPKKVVRQGWDTQFQLMAKHGDDQLLDGEMVSLTNWDEVEWEW